MKYRSYKEAIAFAIDREKEAISVYDLFSRRAQKPATKAMFAALVAEERRHEQALTGLKPEQLTAVKKSLAATDSVEQQINFDPDMDFVAAIKLAIQREEEAMKFYQMLHDESDDPVLKKLFAALAAQERGHRAKLLEEQESVVLRDY